MCLSNWGTSTCDNNIAASKLKHLKQKSLSVKRNTNYTSFSNS